MDVTLLRYAIGLIILAYAMYSIVVYFISILKYKAQIVKMPSTKALRTCWETGDDIWCLSLVLVVLLFCLGLTLLDFFGLTIPVL